MVRSGYAAADSADTQILLRAGFRFGLEEEDRADSGPRSPAAVQLAQAEQWGFVQWGPLIIHAQCLIPGTVTNISGPRVSERSGCA